jgi:predicted ATP-dependent protease
MSFHLCPNQEIFPLEECEICKQDQRQAEEIQALKAQLESAKKVIEFYGEIEVLEGEHGYTEAIKEDHWEALGTTARNWLLQNKESK